MSINVSLTLYSKVNQLQAEIDKDKAVLIEQREAMDKLGRLREALALAGEERAALEVELTEAQNR